MVAASKSSKSTKAKVTKPAKVAKPKAEKKTKAPAVPKQPSAKEIEAKKNRERQEFVEDMSKLRQDVREAELNMVHAKQFSKEATQFYNGCVSKMQRRVDEYENPQQSLPLFHGNPAPAQQTAAQQPANPVASTGNEAWRGVLLSSLKFPKSALKSLTDAGITTIGLMVDWQKEHNRGIDGLPGIGPGMSEKVSDCMEAFWKANQPTEAKAETQPEAKPDPVKKSRKKAEPKIEPEATNGEAKTELVGAGAE